MSPRAAPTHFLCIPLAGPQLTRSLAAFKADVTSELSFAIPHDAVRPLGTLHLTLGVMSLKPETVRQTIDELRRLKPLELLADLRKSAQRSPHGRAGGLSIDIKGLHAMHSASSTSVLYAPPTEAEGILYRFCERLRKPFLDSGLMADDHRPLLLHATIINTVYVRGRNTRASSGGGRRPEKLMLDATDLLMRYGDYTWIENMPVRKVSLCRMGAKPVGHEGDQRYEVEAEIRF